MTTIAAGSSATINVASGGSVSTATNGGFWTTTETPTGGAARTSNHGPTAHTRVFGPYIGGATLTITNQSVNAFNYVEYELSAAVFGTVAVGASQSFTLADQGSVTVSNPAGYWQVAVTPLIGNPSTTVYGPGAGNMGFGPYPAGATVVVSNISGAVLVTSAIGSGAVVPNDADVTAYSSSVTAAGGSLPAAHQTALNTYMPALKASGAWDLVKEMWFPLGADGDLVTARVKLKPGTATKSVTTPNMVAGDYTVAIGFDQGAAANLKDIRTDFAPATATLNGALSNQEWGYGAYVTRQASTNTVGVIMGSTAANTFIGYLGGNTSIGNTNVATAVARVKRYNTSQQTAGTAVAYVGGYPSGSSASASPGAFFAGGMSVGSTGNGNYGDQAFGGYTIHAAMTPAQLRAVQSFFDNVSQAIGRTIFAAKINAIGDSYVAPAPTGPSDPAHDYIAVTATGKGLAWALNGVGGRQWATFSTQSACFGQVVQTLLNQPSLKTIFPMGINDNSDTAVSAAMYTLLDFLNAVGYPLNYVMFGTAYWSPALASVPAWTAICAAQRLVIATTNPAYAGIRGVDFAAGRTYNVPAYQSSGLHQNDTGHAQLSLDLVDAMATWP